MGEKRRKKVQTFLQLSINERRKWRETNEDDIVLDPFCGSSTTGVAARKLGRKYIGIDNNNDYIEISRKRLEKVTK